MTTQLTNEGWFNGSSGKWTKSNDSVRDLRKGIELSSRSRVRTLSGNDLIDGARSLRSGLKIAGALHTEAGNDVIRGVSENQQGILNEGPAAYIKSGSGDDQIIGESVNSRGLENQATIYTGDGQDRITGRSSSEEGITNSNSISMGTGNDTLIGAGVLAGLRNDEYIDMGSGSDVVDVRTGGFAGTGYLYMGTGFDKVFGFGSQTIDGGGDRDSLFLKQGKYRIADNTDKWGYTYGKTIKDRSGTSMVAKSFESIGSILSGEEVDLKNGTLLINATGEVSYL